MTDNPQNNWKILIVEDKKEDIFLVEHEIKRVWPDSVVEYAISVRDGFELIKQKKYDLIILDLNLPDGFGPATVADVRKAVGANMPIIVLTELLTSITIEESLKNGANDVLPKSKIRDAAFRDSMRQQIKKMQAAS